MLLAATSLIEILSTASVGLAVVALGVSVTLLQRRRLELEEQKLRMEYTLRDQESRWRHEQESLLRSVLSTKDVESPRTSAWLRRFTATPDTDLASALLLATTHSRSSREVALEQKLDSVAALLASLAEGRDAPAIDAPPQTNGLPGADESRSLVREISHSLNTPLSQIEAATSRVQVELAQIGGAKSEELDSILDRVLSSVDVAKAFLVAFRGLTDVAASAPQWEPESVPAALAAAADVYLAAAGRDDVGIDIDLPDELPGVDNTFVLALILPLLENAIEGASSGTTVAVDSKEENGVLRVAISNDCDVASLPDDMYSEGVTTKLDHQGWGLPVVKRLLTSRRESNVEHTVAGNRITFVLSLPVRT